MINSPLELLSRDEDLAEKSIDSRLARVETSCCCDLVLVVENISAYMCESGRDGTGVGFCT